METHSGNLFVSSDSCKTKGKRPSEPPLCQASFSKSTPQPLLQTGCPKQAISDPGFHRVQNLLAFWMARM